MALMFLDVLSRSEFSVLTCADAKESSRFLGAGLQKFFAAAEVCDRATKSDACLSGIEAMPLASALSDLANLASVGQKAEIDNELLGFTDR